MKEILKKLKYIHYIFLQHVEVVKSEIRCINKFSPTWKTIFLLIHLLFCLWGENSSNKLYPFRLDFDRLLVNCKYSITGVTVYFRNNLTDIEFGCRSGKDRRDYICIPFSPLGDGWIIFRCFYHWTIAEPKKSYHKLLLWTLF